MATFLFILAGIGLLVGAIVKGKIDNDFYNTEHPTIICPCCQMMGQVHFRHMSGKRGISGGKATAAVLTGGMSLAAVGLSQKTKWTQGECLACGSKWVQNANG